MDWDRIEEVLSNGESIEDHAFPTLRFLGRASAEPKHEARVRDAAIRLLERRDELGPWEPVLDGLLRQTGLFPYLDPVGMSLADAVAYEAHRPANIDNLVFHRMQAAAYRELAAGKNVILSAPTSFGKSLIIDAILALGKFSKVVIVVPTIALIDETRRRLAKFKPEYHVVTHGSQALTGRDVLVMTQERVLERDDLDDVDFFVIDEFYKMSIAEEDEHRRVALNRAFHRLFKTGAQFYLLGPNIEAIPKGVEGDFNCVFLRTDFSTVASVVHDYSQSDDPTADAVKLCDELHGRTLVFCKSPASADALATAMVESGRFRFRNDGLPAAAADWLSQEYHPEWVLTKAIRRGIGIHHGKMQRSLAQFQVRAFNEGLLDVLICTSTLIEGVNTAARNVIVFDNKIALKKLDFFTFNNISGRSGRMFEHFVGHVFLFHEAPAVSLPEVDLPTYTQGEDTPLGVLVELDDDELHDRSKTRASVLDEHPFLTREFMRRNSALSPEEQMAVADFIASNRDWARQWLTWNQYPTYEQLVAFSDLVWQCIVKPNRRRLWNVKSYKQLAFIVSRLQQKKTIRDVLEDILERDTDVDGNENLGIETALDQIRRIATFSFPQFLVGVDSVAQVVLPEIGIEPGNFRYYAFQLENQFVAPELNALEEYGVPIQVSARLSAHLEADGDLDATLERLKSLDTAELGLHPFERVLLTDAQQFA